MPKSKRSLHATAALTTTPPTSLPVNHRIARVLKPAGNNLYYVEYPHDGGSSSSGSAMQDGVEILAELHSRFRNAIWLKSGTFVVVDGEAMRERENKLGGEIVNVVREEKQWRKMGWWPKEFAKKELQVFEGSDEKDEEQEEESTMGKMPPSDEGDASNEVG